MNDAQDKAVLVEIEEALASLQINSERPFVFIMLLVIPMLKLLPI